MTLLLWEHLFLWTDYEELKMEEVQIYSVEQNVSWHNPTITIFHWDHFVCSNICKYKFKNIILPLVPGQCNLRDFWYCGMLSVDFWHLQVHEFCEVWHGKILQRQICSKMKATFIKVHRPLKITLSWILPNDQKKSVLTFFKLKNWIIVHPLYIHNF